MILLYRKINAIKCAPLRSGAKVIGVIDVNCVEKECKFLDNEIALISALNNAAAAAITRALANSTKEKGPPIKPLSTDPS